MTIGHVNRRHFIKTSFVCTGRDLLGGGGGGGWFGSSTFSPPFRVIIARIVFSSVFCGTAMTEPSAIKAFYVPEATPSFGSG